MFSRKASISQLTQEADFQPQYFRPNTNLSLGGIRQPKEVQLHVFTSSNSNEIRLGEIVSIIITLSIPNGSPKNVTMQFSDFLTKLFENSFERLKNLKLSRFRMNASLWASLSKLRLNLLHLTSLYWTLSTLAFRPFQGLKDFIWS